VLMLRRPPSCTRSGSPAASDVYKGQVLFGNAGLQLCARLVVDTVAALPAIARGW